VSKRATKWRHALILKLSYLNFSRRLMLTLRSSGMWGLVLRYISADVSEVWCPHHNLPICCSEQFVRKFLPVLVSIHQTTWQHILQKRNLIFSLIPNTLYRMPRPDKCNTLRCFQKLCLQRILHLKALSSYSKIKQIIGAHKCKRLAIP
jgi:hypothetical protein